MRLSSLSVLALPFSLVQAIGLQPVEAQCFNAIYEGTGAMNFVGDITDLYYYNLCANPLKVCSMFASAALYCTPKETEIGSKLINGWCEEYGGVALLDPSVCTGNLSIDSEVVKTYPAADLSQEYGANFTTITVLSADLWAAQYKTVTVWLYEQWLHQTYGFAMYAFWGIILVIGMLNNLWNTIWHLRASRTASDAEGGRDRATGPMSGLYHQFQTHIAMPSVFKGYHRRLAWGFSIPTRLEAFIIWSYWIISIVLCCVKIETFEGNLYFAKVSWQAWRYVADRTGVICYANLPIMWMFSGRNNVFLWATGWDFGLFNTFHKHIARVATLQALVHSIAYTWIYITQEGEAYYRESLKEAWLYLGVVATCLMCLLLIFSSIWLRIKSYETFLIIHIVFAIVIVYSLFKHTSIYGTQYNPYLWPIVAIWCFDRFLRLVRQVYCNVRVNFDKRGLKLSRSEVTYDDAANVIRLAITPATSLIKPAAGHYYYVYKPVGWKGWENHPFTLGSWGSKNSMILEKHAAPAISNKEVHENPASESDTISSSQNSTQGVDASSEQQLIFWIRPYDGWTRTLKENCKKSPNGTWRSWMMIEGPYGHHIKLSNYESVLLIAGGTGISAVAAQIEEYTRRTSGLSRTKNSSCRTRSVELVWSCKQLHFIQSLCAGELKSTLGRSDIQTKFFSTSSSHKKANSAALERVETNNSGAIEVEVNQGRPDIAETVLQAARVNMEAGSRAGRLAVLVCGPASMADDTRAAVRRAMKEGCRNIEFFEETFGW